MCHAPKKMHTTIAPADRIKKPRNDAILYQISPEKIQLSFLCNRFFTPFFRVKGIGRRKHGQKKPNAFHLLTQKLFQPFLVL